MAERRIQLTRQGYYKLQRELNILTSEENSKVAEMLAEAREDDQGEEAVFFDAMVSKERLDERVSHLQNVLARAEIIDADEDPNTITAGNRVTVLRHGGKGRIHAGSAGSRRDHARAARRLARFSGGQSALGPKRRRPRQGGSARRAGRRTRCARLR